MGYRLSVLLKAYLVRLAGHGLPLEAREGVRSTFKFLKVEESRGPLLVSVCLE